ncbi:MAG: hypothetical protein E6J69_08610 [Deltaproteobacteria bacterium]|nr:MAG: hypothetical protein E6J69_08610 [Deltaproteobacteria bacterium]
MKQSFVFVVVLAASLVRPSGRAAAETPTEKRLRLLEEKLRQAEEEIRELKGQVQQQKAIGQATQKQVEQTAEEAKTAAAEAKKGVELPDWTKRTTIFGDVRARHEGFYHQPHQKTQVVTARNRERLRARLGVRVAFSDELSATIRGASGDPNNPISPNEDLGGNFTRKHFNLDWAYLTFAPGASFGIRPGAASITLGKFPNPIFRVGEMVFDEDLSPEGASETFQLLDKPMGALDQVKVHGLQWTFTEISNKEDGWMFGGQVNPTLHFGNVQLEAGVGQFWWLNSDLIAQALTTNKSLTNTNLLDKDAKGTTTGYLSGFNQSSADDAHGWQAGVRLGQPKVRGDWSIYGLYEHIGQEAAISAFTYSDFGSGGTNLEGPVVGAEYQLLNPFTVSVRNHFTNFINRPAGMTNPTLSRLQLDALVKF